jgi:starch phosphorylase
VFARERLQQSLREQAASTAEIAQAAEVLDPSILTIGFARRFATYKRATLFMHDLERIRRILLGAAASQEGRRRTVQFIIAGKAHPKDTPGKELIRDIIHFSRQEGINHHLVFLPNYDLHVAKLMVAGCDVWLNTPLRPLEASGTSGMKASMNGLPNLSTLDGWWAEADYLRTGWPIGHGEVYDDINYQNNVEASALYELLEHEIVPMFYDRDDNDIPRAWVAKMKDAIRLNCPVFNTARMVRDYAIQGYFPASDRFQTMTADRYQPAKELARWKARLTDHWYRIKVADVDVSTPPHIQVSQQVAVKARVHLGTLTPDDVQVILYQGPVSETGEIIQGAPMTMDYQGQDDHGDCLYTAEIAYASSGLQGLALQVLPHHDHLSSPYEMDLALWA